MNWSFEILLSWLIFNYSNFNIDVSFTALYKKIEDSVEEISLNIKSDFISSIQNLKSMFE